MVRTARPVPRARRALASALLASALLAGAAAPERAAGAPSLGTNLNWMADWDPEKLPADLVWSARPWALRFGNGASDGDPWAPVDGRGWPVVPVGTQFGAVFEGSPWPGIYKLSFENRQGKKGDQVRSYSGNVRVTNRKHDAASNVTTYDVVVPEYAREQLIWLLWSGATGGITNVHLMRPLKDGKGWHAVGTPLSDHVVDRLRWFSTIRVMQTQGGDEKSTGRDRAWADRTSPWGPQTRSRGSPGHHGGVAIENLSAMANQVHKDLWINVPYDANDEYLRKMAQTLKCGSDGFEPWVKPGTSTCAEGKAAFAPLDPALRLYVEHGNELWNSSAGYWEAENEAAARAAVAAGDAPHLDAVLGSQAANDSGVPGWGWRRTGFLAVRHSLIFRAVFGDAAMMTRVRPVLATQHGRYGTTLHPLRYIDSVWGPASPFDQVGGYANPRRPVDHYLYALATAPYVPADNRKVDPSSPATLLASSYAQMTANTPGAVLRAMKDNAAYAARFGVRYVAYEGGSSLICALMRGGASATTLAAAKAASFDPAAGRRMGARVDAASGLPLPDQSDHVYGTLLQGWQDAGGELFVHFTLGQTANENTLFGLCAPTSYVPGADPSRGASSSDCRHEFGPKWDAIKAFSARWSR